MLSEIDAIPFVLALAAGLMCFYVHWGWMGRNEAVAMPALVAAKRLLSENKRVHFFLTVRLDPRVSDGRQAEIEVGPPCWKALEQGELVEVLAMPVRPPMVVWSPLIWSGDAEEAGAYPVLALILGGLAAVLFVLSIL